MQYYPMFRRIGYFTVVAAIMGLMWLSFIPARLGGSSGVALAASDPVIAAAGSRPSRTPTLTPTATPTAKATPSQTTTRAPTPTPTP